MTLIDSSRRRIFFCTADRQSTVNEQQSSRFARISTTRYLFLLIFTISILPGHSQTEESFQVDTDFNRGCFGNLFASDGNGDLRVDNEEYVTFVKLEGPEGFLPNINSFVELPIMLQSNFYTLACLCRTQSSGGGVGCCVGENAHLNANGTAPDMIPTMEQENYLNLVCALTAQSIDMAVSEQTQSPTELFFSDAPSMVPSQLPSSEPTAPQPISSTPGTQSPTTEAPSSFLPTESPTTTEPTVTSSPTTMFNPSNAIVRTSYSIIVPNGLLEDIPYDSYEPDLIRAMDEVALTVGSSLNDFSTPAPEDPGERKLRRKHPLEESEESLIHDDIRLLQEVVITIPTQIVEVVNVGFSSTPQLIGGTFVRGPCPHDLGDFTTDLCQEVTASILLDLSSTNSNPLLVYGLYLAAMDRAILEGELGAALMQVAPDSVAVIASGQASQGGPPLTSAPTMAPTDDGSSRSGLSGGAIAGISAGVILLLFLLWYAISAQREYERKLREKKESARKLREDSSRKNEDDPEAAMSVEGYESEFDGDAGAVISPPRKEQSLKGIRKKGKKNGEASTTVASTATGSDKDGQQKPIQSNLGQQLIEEEQKRPEEEDIIFTPDDDPASMLAAAVPYINSPTREKEKVDLQPRVEIEGSDQVIPNGSYIPPESRSTGNVSHESEAGWSEAYTSSMGSVSDDELPLETSRVTPPSGQQMVSILPNSPLAQGKGQGATAEEKYGELESALIAGDWAAVGATAAALASLQDGQSKSEVSKSTTGRSALSSQQSRSWKDKLDTDKANQLTQLIEQGDWEGIVLAAANYEAEATGATNIYNLGNPSVHSSDGSHGDVMVHEDGSDDEDDVGRGYYSESNQSSRRSSRSSVPSQKRSRDELRAEIAALVEQVVPEEVDHVDEMLDQFAGRESELIETLATMQERAEAMNSANGRSAKSLFKGKL